MPVNVLYFADFKDITGRDKEIVDLKDYNIRELLNTLFDKYQPLKNLVWNEEERDLKKSISIAVNDSMIPSRDKLSYLLSDGDRVAFLMPISGG